MGVSPSLQPTPVPPDFPAPPPGPFSAPHPPPTEGRALTYIWERPGGQRAACAQEPQGPEQRQPHGSGAPGRARAAGAGPRAEEPRRPGLPGAPRRAEQPPGPAPSRPRPGGSRPGPAPVEAAAPPPEGPGPRRSPLRRSGCCARWEPRPGPTGWGGASPPGPGPDPFPAARLPSRVTSAARSPDCRSDPWEARAWGVYRLLLTAEEPVDRTPPHSA